MLPVPSASGGFDLLPQIDFVIMDFKRQNLVWVLISLCGHWQGVIHDDFGGFKPFSRFGILSIAYAYQPFPKMLCELSGSTGSWF
jgi:hypothetical protein